MTFYTPRQTFLLQTINHCFRWGIKFWLLSLANLTLLWCPFKCINIVISEHQLTANFSSVIHCSNYIEVHFHSFGHLTYVESTLSIDLRCSLECPSICIPEKNESKLLQTSDSLARQNDLSWIYLVLYTHFWSHTCFVINGTIIPFHHDIHTNKSTHWIGNKSSSQRKLGLPD